MDEDPNEIDLDAADVTEANDKENDVIQVTTEIKEKKKKKKKPKIQFRNYIPKCPKLRKKYCVPPAQFIEIKDEFTELIEKAKVLNHDIHDIAPKKANWDLKRDCQPQLDKLKYLTQLAIRQIVEEGLLNESESESGDTDDSDEESAETDDTNDE